MIHEHLIKIKSKGEEGYTKDFFGNALSGLGEEKLVRFTLGITMKTVVRDVNIKKYVRALMTDEAEGTNTLDSISDTDHAFAILQYLSNHLEKLWTSK